MAKTASKSAAPADPEKERNRQFWVAKAVLDKLRKMAKEANDEILEERAQAATNALMGKQPKPAAQAVPF